MGPELHQYLVENDTDGRPFDRDTRSVIYERAKNVGDKKPFGTEHDVYEAGYSWLNHSISPRPMVADPENEDDEPLIISEALDAVRDLEGFTAALVPVGDGLLIAVKA